MVQWTILAAVKILKLAVLGTMSMVSYAADYCGCTTEQSVCLDTTTVVTAVVVHSAGADWMEEAQIAMPVAPCTPETARVVTRLERIGRLAPPVRVEMTFTPDLLRPPTRDPSL